MDGRKYDTDLTDEQWKLIQPLLPPASSIGAPRRVDRRAVVNAILYVVRSGCQWRLLPKDFPCWKTVYHLFWQWREGGRWLLIHDQLRRMVRRAAGRSAEPRVGIVDSQSVRTTSVGGERGYDPAKRINGRKRHLLVDTMGMIITLLVHSAGFSDQDGACFLFSRGLRGRRRPRTIWGDSAYQRNELPAWVRKQFGCELQVVHRPKGIKGWLTLPKRWIVERTFAWISQSRRHSKDYERTVESSEAMILITMINLMLKRLTAPEK